jgi:hypothetical protein
MASKRMKSSTLLKAGTLSGIAAVIGAIATLAAVFIQQNEQPPQPFPSPPAPDTSQVQSLKPIANAGGNKEVQEGEAVTLDGTESAAADPDGKIVSYRWVQTGGGVDVALIDDNTANPRFAAPGVPSDTKLEFKLTVMDDKGRSSIPDSVLIIIKNVNKPPVANAGIEQIVNPGDIVSLDATNSTDPDRESLTYSWKQVGGPAIINLNDADTPIATFIAPSNISGDTYLIFKLTVTDSSNAISADSVKVTAMYIPRPNNAPVAEGKNITANMNINTDIALTGSDADKDKLTFSIVTDPLHGTLGETNQEEGIVTYTPDSGFIGKDSFTYKVNDGTKDSNTATVSVTINPPPNNIPKAEGQNVITDENQPVNIQLSASDKDNDGLSGTYVSTPLHGQLSKIDLTNGKVTYTPDTNFIGKDSFAFKVNDGKADSNIATVSITVNSITKELSNQTAEMTTQQKTVGISQVIKQIAKQVATANPGTNSTHVYQILVQLAKQTAQTSGQAEAIKEIRQISSQVGAYPFGAISQSLSHFATQVKSGDNVADIIKQIIQERSSGEDISQSIVNAAIKDSVEHDEES